MRSGRRRALLALAAALGVVVVFTIGLVVAEGAFPLRLNVLPDADARRMLASRLGMTRVIPTDGSGPLKKGD